MTKASWTKRFAAGWGEPGAATALGGLVESARRESAGVFCEKSLTMRAAVAKPRSLHLKNAAHGVAIDLSGYRPVGVTVRRIEDTHRGTASGNCRSGGIAALPRRDPPLRREPDRSVPPVGSMPPISSLSWAVARCRPALPRSREPRRNWTALASRGARARSI